MSTIKIDKDELENMKLRIGVFYSICIPIRIGLVVLLYYYTLQEFAIPLFALAVGFGYQYGLDRKRGGFGGEVYWNRFLHAVLYFLSASMLMFNQTREYAYVVLAVDVGMGILSNTLYNLKVNA